MITPKFPYTGDQIIVTSDRVTLHSRKDGVFVFGKATVGLSSVGTINMDSKEKVLIDSPKIELGHRAEELGEQAVLGNSLSMVLTELSDALGLVANAMSKADGTTQESAAASLSLIKIAGSQLKSAITNVQSALPGILSETTYTT